MAYSQLGYPYASTPQFLISSSPLSGCLEPGGRSLVDTITPPSHPALSCPVYESRALHSPGQELTPTTGIGVYNSAYPKSQGYYSTCSSDAAAVYSTGVLGTKEEAVASCVRGPQTPAYYPYDYAFGQYTYERYGYTCSDAASRRKNATRETTSTLKTWLQEHQKNPYPTKGEKIMLAIITKMTLTQVSTWFANARRRLKKENKVTWSPRANKSSDDRCCDEDSDGGEESLKEIKCVEKARPGDIQSDMEDFDLLESEGSDCEPKLPFYAEDPTTAHSLRPFKDELHENERLSPNCSKTTPEQHGTPVFHPEHDHGVIEAKPKIWSIAQTAVSLNPAVQSDYLPCMLLSDEPSSTKYPSHVDPTTTEGQQDSPVTSLREWVDGVFHEPLFQQRPFMRAQPKSADTWKGSSFEDPAAL